MKGNYKAAAAFKQAVAAAKKLYKTGRYKTFADAVKAAYKKKGVSGVSKKYRQTGTSNLSADKKRKAKPPGKRVVKHAGGKSTVYYERRKNRSDKPGSVSGLKAAIRTKLNERLKTLLWLKEKAGLKSMKRKYSKSINEVKRQLKTFE